MTALLQKLMDVLDLRGLSLNTKKNYVGAVYRLARHFNKSPDRITDEELRQHLLSLIRDHQRTPGTLNVIVSAFRFFYGQVLHRSLAGVPGCRCRLGTQFVEVSLSKRTSILLKEWRRSVRINW